MTTARSTGEHCPNGSPLSVASRVSVVIPAFNEGQAVNALLAEIRTHPTLSAVEVIVVDDGSTDDTAAQVAQCEQVRLVRHKINRGYGAALVTGMHRANRDYVVWMDADGQHRPADLAALTDHLVGQDLDYCIGVRDALSYQDPRRRLGKWMLRQVVSLAAGQRVADFNSGLRGFRRSVIRRYLHLLPKGFGASTTTTLIMIERGYCGCDLPISARPRIGTSSMKPIRDGLRTLTLMLRIFLLFKPLHFFGLIGLAMTVVGLCYGLWSALVQGLGFPVLGAVVLLSGVQTMFLGLVMDQISAMRRERFE